MKKEGHIGISPFANLRGDADVGNGRPRIEKVIQELHEISLANSVLLAAAALFLLGDHLE
jgi:hypothetical protein